MNRRDFLKSTAAAAAAGVSFPYFVPRHVMAAPGRRGANDRFKVGFIGVGARANQLINDQNLFDHADIVAICDIWPTRIDQQAKRTANSEKWRRYHDHREFLEKEKLDAVFIPTPTHNRAMLCIDALKAGFDVYAEKPVCLTVAEGQAMVKAARKYNRVFQVGTQQRSMPSNVYASKLVREGAIGKITEVVTCNFLPPERWTPQPGRKQPADLNWDAWCGQTELRPYHPELHLHWTRWWDYDGGGRSWGVTGWGTHALDQVQCALGTDYTGPVEIWPEEPGQEGKVTMRYANGTLLKLHRPPAMKWTNLDDLGATFVGEKGTIQIKRGSFDSTIPELLKDQPTTMPANVAHEVNWHFDNFFDCLRTRKRPNADIEIAHRSTTVCYLVNICRDLGRKLHWDPKAEKFIGDEEANKMLSRERRKGYELPTI